MKGQCTDATIRTEKCGRLMRGSEKAAAVNTKEVTGRQDREARGWWERKRGDGRRWKHEYDLHLKIYPSVS